MSLPETQQNGETGERDGGKDPMNPGTRSIFMSCCQKHSKHLARRGPSDHVCAQGKQRRAT